MFLLTDYNIIVMKFLRYYITSIFFLWQSSVILNFKAFYEKQIFTIERS